MTPHEFRHRVKQAYDQVRDFVTRRGNDRLRARWVDWDLRFKGIFEQSRNKPEVAISLVGGTGAGKSTLLNALIGSRILPVSNMRACTAAISEVAFNDGDYQARIEFVPRESWQKEVQTLQDDLRDAVVEPPADGVGDPRPLLTKTARDKLWTVYRSSEDAPVESFNPLELVEPPEVAQALDRGSIEFQEHEEKRFRERLSVYLDSKHRFWPIVKSVSIRGRFEPLRDGAKLIDLPGVNDPNDAREAVTKTHLKTCRFVWIVFNIKRALTKDTLSLMLTDDFMRQIVMDGRAEALTFVGTASDDLDIETAIEEFDLEEDAPQSAAVAARNMAVEKVVHHQLEDLSLRMAHLAQESRDTAARLAVRLKKSEVYSVSAKEYMRLAGLSRSPSGPLSHVNETQIPKLKKHMLKLCASFGVESHINSLERQLDLLITEIRREVQSQRAILKNQAEVTEQQRKEVRAAVDAAQTFLDRDLKDAEERLTQDLDAGQGLLAERVKRAVDRANLDLEQTTLRRWATLHHNTVRAVCRRDGVHIGTVGKNDFPADICKPILDGIAFAWSDFFGEKLQQTLEKWAERLHRHSDDYRRRLLDTLGARSDLPPELLQGLKGVFSTTERVVNELLSQTKLAMHERIIEKQRSLYEVIPDQVKANMQSAFVQAAEERGFGMKQRIVEILSLHAKRVSRVMFDDAQEALLSGVRSLNDWLAHEYHQMTAAVTRNARLAAENLVSGRTNLTAASVERELQMLAELETLILEHSRTA